MKRLLIFFFYDKQGIVDDYITYMLSDLKSNVTQIMLVSNGKINADGKEKLGLVVDRIFIRENIGFDVWAYKEGMEQYGWDELMKYDEVILMNFTMYGPLYPFKEMFEVMDRKDIDFWGITKHHGFDFDPFGTIPYGYIPEHIQSSFISIRNSMLASKEFQEYWDTMPPVNSYGEAVGKHEAIFTKKFTDLGFRSDVYINTDDLLEDTHYPLMIMPLELVKNRRCPVIKRKSFTNEYYEFLNCCVGEPTVEVYEYIEKHLDYDINLIWDNLLRIENMADIKNRMHLNYILPKYRILRNSKVNKKIALFLHIFFEDQIENCLKYAQSMPEEADIFITTDTEDKIKKIYHVANEMGLSKIKPILVENRGRDVSALLVGCRDFVMDYDLVCFAHDKKTTQFKPYTIGKSFSYKCFENVLGSKEYVLNIIDTFENNQRLGMLVPPPPNHAAFYGLHGTEWGDNFGNTVSVCAKLGMSINIDITKEPIAPLGTMFWFRTVALKKLFDQGWEYHDFPAEPNENDGTILHAIERVYPFVAQNAGYYSAWLMNDKFAAIELTNLHFMIREMSMTVYNAVGHQAGFNMANYTLLKNISARKIVKESVKKRVPTKVWRFMSKVYRKCGGKKWLV